MKALLSDLRKHFDMVLIDSPAFLPVTDAAVLAPLADGVLLVVRRAHVGRAAVRSACRELADVGAKLIGLVVNQTNKGSSSRYHTYYRIPDTTPKGDPLTKIDGIGPKYERALNAIGIVSFAQLAEQDPETLEEKMGARIRAERIRRDRWVEQAKTLLLQENADRPAENDNNSKPGK
jgi:Mrp family chromosome partitioning ATPase